MKKEPEMKFINLEWDAGEAYNDLFRAKVYSLGSKQTYTLDIEVDEKDESKIKKFDCTCKGVTIPKSLGKEYTMCKHLKRFQEVLKLMGYLQ